MAKRKAKKYRDINASISIDDTYATIFDSMLKSKAFIDLSPTAKVLYICCRNQAQSKAGKESLLKHCKEFNNYIEYGIDFVLPAKHLEEYGIDRRNADRYFKELIAAGFIIKKEINKYTFKVNVYSFSSKWKDTS